MSKISLIANRLLAGVSAPAMALAAGAAFAEPDDGITNVTTIDYTQASNEGFLSLKQFKLAFEAAGNDEASFRKLSRDVWDGGKPASDGFWAPVADENEPEQYGLILTADEWKQLIVDDFLVYHQQPNVLSTLIIKAHDTLTPDGFGEIANGLESIIKSADEPIKGSYPIFIRNFDEFKNHPDLITAILQHARRFAEQRDFDRVVGDIIDSPDILSYPAETFDVIIDEGMAYFDGNNRNGEILSLPSLYRLNPSDQNANRNAMAILAEFDFSKTQGMSVSMALEYAQNLHGYRIDNAAPAIEAVLKGVATHHPDEFGPNLKLAINILGDDKAAEIVGSALARTNAQVSFLKDIQIEFEPFYERGILQLPSEHIEAIALRGAGFGVHPSQVQQPNFYLSGISETHYGLYRAGVSNDFTIINASAVQNALIANINFELMRNARWGRHTQDLDGMALRSLASGNPLAINYVKDYLFEKDPKRILTHPDLKYIQEDPEAFAELTRSGLAALGYDPDFLIEVTGKSLEELPYPLIHQTASDETLSEAMLLDPIGEFQANIPSFGEPSAISEEGYVISVEFSNDGGSVNYQQHLMATTNIMDRTLTAVGQTDITTIAIDAGRGGSESFLEKGGQLLDGALVVQSSTSTTGNRLKELGLTNDNLIMVYSAGNKGDRPDFYAQESEEKPTSLSDISSDAFASRHDPNTQYNTQDPTTYRHLAVANTIEFGASIYDPETGIRSISSYSNTDGQVFVTVPGFLPGYNFHSQENGPYNGRFETGTSFFSPSGAAYVAEAIARAKTEFPDLQPHQILYAMAQTSEHIGVVEGITTISRPEEGIYGSELFSVAAPHGVEFNQRGGFGDFRREGFYTMLGDMQEAHNRLVLANPELANTLSPDVISEEAINYTFTQDNAELRVGEQQQFPMAVELDKIVTRPVFTINYDFAALEEKWSLKQNVWGGYNLTDHDGNIISREDRMLPVTISAPNGASFDYVVDIWAARGMATISGVGFMGAETQGQWNVQTKNSGFSLPVQSIDLNLFTTSKDDLITLPEFRKQHTLESIVGQDLSHLSNVWLQDGGVDGNGGWISDAVENGWQSQLNLSGTSLDMNLMQTLPRSSELQTGFMTAGQQTSRDLTSSPIPKARPWSSSSAEAVEIPLRPKERPLSP